MPRIGAEALTVDFDVRNPFFVVLCPERVYESSSARLSRSLRR
jgi:hypothetical protein